MSERATPNDEGVTRRDFLKFAGAAAALGAAGAAGKALYERGEAERAAIVQEMKGNTTEVIVTKEKYAVESFIEESGWSDYPHDYFDQAVKELNNLDKNYTVQEGQQLIIPFKENKE